MLYFGKSLYRVGLTYFKFSRGVVIFPVSGIELSTDTTLTTLEITRICHNIFYDASAPIMIVENLL